MRCKCKCCLNNVNENLRLGRNLCASIRALEKIKATPQFGLAYSIAKDALAKITRARGDDEQS